MAFAPRKQTNGRGVAPSAPPAPPNLSNLSLSTGTILRFGNRDDLIKQVRFPDLDDKTGRPTCSICYYAFTPSDEVIALGCGHVFHASCLKRFVQVVQGRRDSARCPICRTELLESELDELGIEPPAARDPRHAKWRSSDHTHDLNLSDDDDGDDDLAYGQVN